jgi:hypothetical protein
MKLKLAFIVCVFVAGLAASLAVATPPPGKGNNTTTGTTTTTTTSKKVTLCHKTQSKKHPYVKITVSKSAVKAYTKHGDVFPNADGTCPKAPETTTTTTTTG